MPTTPMTEPQDSPSPSSVEIWKERLLRAFLDTWRGLEHCLQPVSTDPSGDEGQITDDQASGYRTLVVLMMGLMVGWWLYVPLHELLHAAGCLWTGGEVTRLEIARAYGGDLYAALFDFVVPESEYAGRLSGFSTFGNDGIYLATDLAPYVLTVFPGVYALRRSVAAGRPFLYGFWLSFALAPFISISGDAYEIGSIVVTWLPLWAEHAELLRSDDLFLWIDTHQGRSGVPWAGAALATFLGLIWAWGTYALGSLLSCRLGYGPIQAWMPAEQSEDQATP